MIEAFTITGPTKPWSGRDEFLATLLRALVQFVREFGREPAAYEWEMLVAAVAKHFSAEEILEPHLRSQ